MKKNEPLPTLPVKNKGGAKFQENRGYFTLSLIV